MKLALLLFLSACGTESKTSSVQAPAVADTYNCEATTKSFQGCCSSHDGFEGTCEVVGDLKFTSEGALVCKDGSLSPSCKK